VPELQTAFVNAQMRMPVTKYHDEHLVGLNKLLLFYLYWNEGISREIPINDDITGLAVSQSLRPLPVCVCHQSQVSLLFTSCNPKLVTV
jgi:hypothetical protein